MSIEATVEETTATPETDVDAPETVTDPPEAPEDGPEAADDDTETPETFPRDYVEKLRKENAGYRDKAKRADDLAHRLHASLVEATGRLADARDLPFDESHLEDTETLTGAIDALVADRPHLGSRKPRGNVGQGAITGAADTVDLAGLLRSRAH